MDMQYNYTAGQNNGRIASSQDYTSGETVQYAYDGLLRLASAQTTGTQWGEAYTYDGFGNLTGKTPTKGSAPALSVSYNPATNQPYNGNYDANGNAPVGTWNVENKLVGQVLDGTQVNWSYDPFGQRVARYTSSGSWWSEWDGHWDFYLYGPTGQRMAQIGCDTISGQQIGGSSWCVSEGTDVYFGGKLIAETDASGQVLAPTDRLGTVRGVNTNGTMAQPTYYPYGEPKTAGGIDKQQQFGTYVRDSTASAQDYAMQRYYSNNTGRFYSPDRKGGTLNSPQSLNRYAYVLDDPVNLNDPFGLCPPGYVPATSSDQLQSIADTAESYTNHSLVHVDGAHYVDLGGVLEAIDCTGLVAQALAGIAYTSNNFQEAPKADQFTTSGIAGLFSAATSPQVGDIIWFPGHAGIVTGVSNGQITSFVGSQSSTGPADVNLTPGNHWTNLLGSAKVFQPCVPAPTNQGASTSPGPEVIIAWDAVYGSEGGIIDEIPYLVAIGNWVGAAPHPYVD
jgi:RHS repeat-associated protein